ncbi:MAG: HlyD family efflux transporter periplasmic adaptor subunit [Opitutaceae bacterium]
MNKKGSEVRRWSRWLPWLVGSGLTALIVVGLLPKPLPAEIAEVARGDLKVTVKEEGMTRVKNRYVIASPVAGQLRRIVWKPGALVEAGKTVLAVLESGGADILDARSLLQAEARVRAAEAAVAQAHAQQARVVANANLQREDFVRQKTLFASGALSRQEFDAAETRVTTSAQEARAADFAGQIAEFEAAQARALLLRGQPAGTAARGEPLVILSPVSGRVLRVMQESERLVPAGFALLEVGDPTDLEARVEVLSRDGVAIQPGARVQLEQWGGPVALNARVRVVEPSAFTKVSALGVEEQRVYVIVDFIDPLEARRSLGDNYRVEAQIETWSGQNILKVPSGALFQRGTQWQTYVEEGNRAMLRAVKVGRSSGRETEILDGLTVGQKVVIYPGDQIANGSRINPIVVGYRD